MNKSPIIKIVVLNIFILSFTIGVFYSIYDFLNNQSKTMKNTRYYVQKIDYDISMINTNLYQSYLSKHITFLVSSAKNSLDVKASIDELSKLGYDTKEIYTLYLNLYKLSVQASSLFLEKNDAEGLVLLKQVQKDYEGISSYLQTILNEIEDRQHKIIQNTNSLIAVAAIFLTIIIIFNISYIVHIFKDLMATTSKVKERAVLLDSIADGVYGVDTNGRCMFINKKALDMIQFNEDEVLFKNQHELFHHHRPDGTRYEFYDCPIHKTAQDRIIRECEETFIRKDGTFFPVSLTISPTSDGNAVVVFRDISYIKDYETHLEHEVLHKTKALNDLNKNLELKVAQEVEKNRQKDILLQQQTRLAAIGEMMGNIAHQWRQPLNNINLLIYYIRDSYGLISKEELNETIKNAKLQIDFMSQTIDDFRNFYKPSKEKKLFNIKDSIIQSSKIVKSSLERNSIELKIEAIEIEIENYENDILDGEYYEYYNDKSIKSQSAYIKGKIKDQFKSYYINTALEKEFNYQDGKLKTATNYFSNGKKSSQALYDDKEQIENYNYYDTEGNLYYVEKFKSGIINSGIQFTAANNNPTEVALTNNKFEIKNFNGTTIVSGNYNNGRKNNLWNYYYPSGSKNSEENYSDNVLEGISKSYDKNGSLNSRRNYTKNKLNGRYEVYDDGKLISIYHYLDDEKNGPYQNFNPDGSLEYEGYFINDHLNYDYKTYWQNGKLYKHSYYIEGSLTSTKTYNQKGEIENEFDFKNKTGIFTSVLFNGTVNRSIQLINGINNGPYTEKDKLGNSIVEANYVNGLLHDNYKYYSPLGLPYYENNYYLGYLNGKSKIYDLYGNLRVDYISTHGVENGKTNYYFHNKSKLSEYTKINDSKEGEHLYYNQEGELILSITYSNNSPVFYVAKNEKNESSKTVITKETANIISYYPNGKIAIQLNLLNGDYDGKFIINNSNGKPQYECNYTNGLLNGGRIEYYSNGTIYKKENFVNNKYEGLQEYFNPDSTPKITAEYKNDQLNGKTTIFTNGKPKTIKIYDSSELVEISK